MKVIIIGGGVIGARVARVLIAENREVVVLERNAEASRALSNELDCIVMNEDGTSLEALRRAGAADADAIVATAGSDEANLLSCAIAAAEFPGARRIARLRNPYFLEMGEKSRSILGLDAIVNPEREIAEQLANLVDDGIGSGMISFGGDLSMRSIKVDESFPHVGKNFRDMRSGAGIDFIACALVRDGGLIIPSGFDTAEPGDLVYFLGGKDELSGLLGAEEGKPLRDVLIVGATNTAEQLARRLLSPGSGIMSRIGGLIGGKEARKRKRRVTIIDSSRDEAKRLSRDFPDALVINDDLFGESADIEEHLSRAESLIACTGSQTYNLVAASYAKKRGVGKAAALVVSESCRRIAPDYGIDAVVSAAQAVSSSFLNRIRGGSMRTLHNFMEDDVELLELGPYEVNRVAGKRVRDISMPKGSLILSIVRGEEALIPGGDTVIEEGDRLCVIAHGKVVERLQLAFPGEGGVA
jgi:trk system potassium uptake protein TrkA